MKTVSVSVSLLIAACVAHAAEHGTWAIADDGSPGKVMLSLMRSGPDGRHSDNSSNWDRSDLTGLAWMPQEKHDVHFTIAHDAGTIEGEGFLKDGEGAGTFHFTPRSGFAENMSALGFNDFQDEDRLFAATVHNLSLNFARQMKAENIAGLDGDKLLAFRIFGVDQANLDDVKQMFHTLPDADKLIAFRIHGVSPDFLRSMRAAGIRTDDPDKLVAFRIHGVSPEFVRNLRAAGVSADDPDKLIAFRIHGVSPEFVRNLRAAGISADDPDKLIAFRIHGVSPEFVQAIERLGYAHPESDKLIALRIHGVTPEYIQSLRSRGVQNMTLDQLIALRISGVN